MKQDVQSHQAAVQALLYGIVYRGGTHHARSCDCQPCVARRDALHQAFPGAATAVAAASPAVDADARYAPGVVFALGGATHAVCCTCTFCRAAAGGGGHRSALSGFAHSTSQPAAGALEVPPGPTPRRGREAKKATAPRAVDTARVILCSDGSFVVGTAKPYRHLLGCRCPNCNRFRLAIKASEDGDGVGLQVEYLTEEQSAAFPIAPAFSELLQQQMGASGVAFDTQPAAGVLVDPLVAKEAIRRARISASNSGRLPWNAGRKHSPETIAKISKSTRAALLDPEVRARGSSCNRGHTVESKAAIGRGIARYLARRRSAALAVLQETLRLAALTAAAIAARSLPGNTWLGRPLVLTDTFTPSRPALLQVERSPTEKEGKARPAVIEGPPLQRGGVRQRSFRAKSDVHRAKLAASMRARWADPEYAERVRSNMRLAWIQRMGDIVPAPVVTKPPRGPKRSKAAVVAAPKPSRAASIRNPVRESKPRRSKATAAQGLSVEERADLASQAHAMLAQAQMAAQALEAAAAAGSPVDATTLAEVHAAVATAQSVLQRVALADAAASAVAEAAAGDDHVVHTVNAPAHSPVPADPVAQASPPRAPPNKVWYRGRLVAADKVPSG